MQRTDEGQPVEGQGRLLRRHILHLLHAPLPWSVRGEERSLSTERTDRDRGRRSKRATATLVGGRLHNLLGDCVQRV